MKKGIKGELEKIKNEVMEAVFPSNIYCICCGSHHQFFKSIRINSLKLCGRINYSLQIPRHAYIVLMSNEKFLWD